MAKLQLQLELMGHLPRTEQRFVIDTLDTVLRQASYTGMLKGPRRSG